MKENAKGQRGHRFLPTVYVRRVYVRRVVEREGVIKSLTVRNLTSPGAEGDCRNAAVHAAAFSHFRHIEPGSGWAGYRRGVATAPGLGCLRTLPPEGGVPGSRVETAPCLACLRRGGGRQGRLGPSRRLRRCTGLRASRWSKPGAGEPRFRSRALDAGKC